VLEKYERQAEKRFSGSQGLAYLPQKTDLTVCFTSCLLVGNAIIPQSVKLWAFGFRFPTSLTETMSGNAGDNNIYPRQFLEQTRILRN